MTEAWTDYSGSKVLYFRHDPVAGPFEHEDSLTLGSAAFVDADTILATSYAHVYRIRLSDGAIGRVALDGVEGRSFVDIAAVQAFLETTPTMESGQVVMPAGIAFDHGRNLTFIANYRCHDVLVCAYDPVSNRARLCERITDESVVSPEGVALSADGNILAVASYEGHHLTVFDRTDEGWRRRWVADLRCAHGVAILGDKVYATALNPVVLACYDIVTGRLLVQRRRKGWNNADGEYLRPVSIAPLDASSLLVTDARTGCLITVGANDLRPRRVVGGKGPTLRWMNLPYCAVADETSVVVVSSNDTGGRITVGHRPTLRMHTNIVGSGCDWAHLKDAHVARDDGEGYDVWDWVDGPRIKIGGTFFCCSVNAFRQVEGDRARYASIPSPASPFNVHRYFHFSSLHKFDEDLLVYSSQSRQMFLVCPRGGVDYFLPFLVPAEAWFVDGEFQTARGVLDMAHMVEGQRRRLSHLLQRGTVIGLRDFYYCVLDWQYQATGLTGGYDEFLCRVAKLLPQEGWRSFVSAWEKAVQPEEVKHEAGIWLQRVAEAPIIQLDAYYLLSMLFGIRQCI